MLQPTSIIPKLNMFQYFWLLIPQIGLNFLSFLNDYNFLIFQSLTFIPTPIWSLLNILYLFELPKYILYIFLIWILGLTLEIWLLFYVREIVDLILLELFSITGGNDVKSVLEGWDEMFMDVFVLFGCKSVAADHKILLK